MPNLRRQQQLGGSASAPTVLMDHSNIADRLGDPTLFSETSRPNVVFTRIPALAGSATALPVPFADRTKLSYYSYTFDNTQATQDIQCSVYSMESITAKQAQKSNASKTCVKLGSSPLRKQSLNLIDNPVDFPEIVSPKKRNKSSKSANKTKAEIASDLSRVSSQAGVGLCKTTRFERVQYILRRLVHRRCLEVDTTMEVVEN